VAKLYNCERRRGLCFVEVRADEHFGAWYSLNPRYDLLPLCPDGLAWGGDGPAVGQLALALIADATGNDGLAVALHVQFRDEFLLHVHHEAWCITDVDVRRMVARLAGLVCSEDQEQAEHVPASYTDTDPSSLGF